MNFMNVVQSTYIGVASRGRYNLAVANAVNSELFTDDLTTFEFLNQNKKVVSGCHLGCCLNFSLYLMVKLKEMGIPSMLISTPEDGGQKASVAYESNGSWYVADIVEDIKFLTNVENEYAKENDFPATYNPAVRKEYKDHFSAHYALPLEEFKQNNESVEMFADIFSFDGKMSEFFNTGHKI